MRQRPASMPQVKPIDKILDLDSYANDRKVIFRITGPDQQPGDASNSVEVPIAIVYRLYYLGIVNDPVAQHYLQLLLPLLKSKRRDTKAALAVLPQ